MIDEDFDGLNVFRVFEFVVVEFFKMFFGFFGGEIGFCVGFKVFGDFFG